MLLFLGIQLLERAPTPKKTGDHTDCMTSASVSGLETKMNRLAEEMKSLSVNVRSTINDSIGCALATRGRGDSNTASSSQEERDIYVPHASLLKKLRNFLGNSKAVFKNPEQAEAIEFTLAYERHLLLVGPTAMGKTLAYMLPASLRNHGITCVLLPLSALHMDFERRCGDLRIESSRWTLTNDRPMTKIVYVSPEHAQTRKFGDYLFEMNNKGHLKQVVLDEVHLIPGHEDFRQCMAGLRPILSCGEFNSRLYDVDLNYPTGVPFLLMTATCPPLLRPKLLSTLGISDCHVIHAPTDRPEIAYEVNLSATLKEAKQKLVKAVKNRLSAKMADSFRGLVYCRSRDDVDELAAAIGCDAFHAGRPEEERRASFKRWVEGKQRFMVCTSLMGCGVDVEDVTVVLHLGTPWSMLDFVQESGRAGRSGKRSTSVVCAAEDEREPDGDGVDLYGKVLMREWVLQTSMCRRVALSSFLDGGRVTCTLLKGAAFCDVCTAESLKEHPGRLVSFPTIRIPTGDVPNPRKLPTIPPTSLEYEINRNAEPEDAR